MANNDGIEKDFVHLARVALSGRTQDALRTSKLICIELRSAAA